MLLEITEIYHNTRNSNKKHSVPIIYIPQKTIDVVVFMTIFCTKINKEIKQLFASKFNNQNFNN